MEYGTRIMIGLAGLSLAAGCVSSSEVVPIGNGRYMITGRASGGLNAGKETTAATKAANEYCAKQSKQMVLQNLDKTGNAAVFGENIDLTFTCEDKFEHSIAPNKD
jgi:hypothetical protein